ncbi:MAG: hypothetical protein MUE44_33115 [Oscillatoriaceae cyanobacterium Prado104]|nr:hypothetical protein [Oscillatoriaceae cyanobacterium Prado104]
MGESIEIFWEREIDALAMGGNSWEDDRAELPEDEEQAEEDLQVVAATAGSLMGITQQEREILDEMGRIASAARHQPDPRILELIEWIKLLATTVLLFFPIENCQPPLFVVRT